MPKKWVREARRRAREEAYRGVGSTEGGGEEDLVGGVPSNNNGNGGVENLATDAYEAQRLLERCALPVKKTPLTWLMCEAKWAYFRTLLVMADESREYVMNSNLHAVKLAEEALLQISLLRVAASSWLVRSTKILTHMAHCDFPKEDYSLLEIATTMRVTHVGNSSIEMEHDVILLQDRKLPKRLATISGTIVPYDSLAKKPRGEMGKEMRDQLSKFVVSSQLQIPRRFDIPSWLIPSGTNVSSSKMITKRGETRFSIRFSDCDAFLHLNNCHAVALFVDAFLKDADTNLLDRVAFIYLDYALPADANVSVVLRSAFSDKIEEDEEAASEKLVDLAEENERDSMGRGKKSNDDEEETGFRWCGSMCSTNVGEEKVLLRAYFTSELDGLSSAL